MTEEERGVLICCDLLMRSARPPERCRLVASSLACFERASRGRRQGAPRTLVTASSHGVGVVIIPQSAAELIMASR
jgi:hypothetical protein